MSANFYLVRLPVLPISILNSLKNASDLKRLCDLPEFRTAIYSSNPQLYNLLDKWINNEFVGQYQDKLTKTFLKYLIRSSTRSTPFGLFSGTGVGNFSTTSSIVLNEGSSHKYNIDLTAATARALRDRLFEGMDFQTLIELYGISANQTFYVYEDTIRFIDTQAKATATTQHLSEMPFNEYIIDILEILRYDVDPKDFFSNSIHKMHGAKKSDFSDLMLGLHACGLAELCVENKIVGSTGNAAHLFRLVKNFETETAKKIRSIATGIDILNSMKVSSLAEKMRKVNDLLENIVDYGDRKSFFSVDTTLSFAENRLNKCVKNDTEKCLSSLAKVYKKNKGSNLDKFREGFVKRYGEGAFIDLNLLLDPDVGIGYPLNQDIQDDDSLVSNLLSVEATNRSSDSNDEWQAFIQRKLNEALVFKYNTIQLTASDFDIHQRNFDSTLPSSFCSIVSLQANSHQDIDFGQKYQLHFKAATGPNAFKLMGRFSQFNKDLAQQICGIAKQEIANNPEVIFAEIIYSDNDVVTDISSREGFYDFEIPIREKGPAQPSKTILLCDIQVTVLQNEVLFYSKKLRKRIVPRLSSAHSHTLSRLPSYQLLCDSQYQGHCHYLAWDWGNLSKQGYLPRVSIDGVIVSREQWYFHSQLPLGSDLSLLLKELLYTYKVKRFVTMTYRDQELLIDTENPLSLSIAADKFTFDGYLQLQESIFDPLNKSWISNAGHQDSFVNEIIIPHVQNHQSYRGDYPILGAIENKNKFEKSIYKLGDEYVYLKIYCNGRYCESILNKVFYPCFNNLKKRKFATTFFFVRYYDPEFHIRLRIRCNSSSSSSVVMSEISNQLLKCARSYGIAEIKSENYVREMHRYRHLGISESEEIFHIDSMFCLALLKELSKKKSLHNIFHYCQASISEYLNVFYEKTEEKIQFTERMMKYFKDEFRYNSNKYIRKSLANFHSSNKLDTKKIVDRNHNIFDLKFTKLISIRSRKLESRARKLAVISNPNERNEAVANFIHMNVNRMLKKNHRANEFMSYFMLHRHYISERARNAK